MQRKWGGGAREWCSVDDVYGSPYTHGLPMKLAGLAVVRRALISWQYMIAMINTSLPAFPAGAHARVYALAIHTSLPPHPSIPSGSARACVYA